MNEPNACILYPVLLNPQCKQQLGMAKRMSWDVHIVCTPMPERSVKLTDMLEGTKELPCPNNGILFYGPLKR